MKKLRIGYFADGPWSHKAFKKLVKAKSIEFSFICVRTDTMDQTLKEYCAQHGIDYLKNKDVNSEEFIAKVSKYQCDLFISMSFNQIFKEEIINVPRLKTINCHAGKLPFYRGRNVLNWALINDEKEFGITVHFVDKGVDTGDIILQKIFEISDEDDYSTILETAYEQCANILFNAVMLFNDGKVNRIRQTDIHAVGFYCSGRGYGDEVIDWNMKSRDVFNFIRAICSPGPMARSYIDGVEIRINKSKIIEEASIYRCKPGVVLGFDNEDFIIKTGDSFIKVVDYEYEKKLKIGDRLEAQ
jgi:methionyl-tRNA formyltransferase